MAAADGDDARVLAALFESYAAACRTGAEAIGEADADAAFEVRRWAVEAFVKNRWPGWRSLHCRPITGYGLCLQTQRFSAGCRRAWSV